MLVQRMPSMASATTRPAPPPPAVRAAGGWAFPVRYLVVCMLFAGFLISYAIRLAATTTAGALGAERGFDNSTVGVFLSAFFVGYLLLQLPAGYAATRLGGHLVLGIGVMFTALITVVTPLASHSLPALVVLRALAGLGQGCVYPATHALISRWAPAGERSGMLTFVWSGAFVGSVVALPTSAWLVANGRKGPDGLAVHSLTSGWPAVYYVFGLAGIVWAGLWLLLASSSPTGHHFISSAEAGMIVASQRVAAAGEGPPREDGGGRSDVDDHDRHVRTVPVPWKRILTTPAVWALAAAHVAHNWTWYLLLTWSFEYIHQQLGFDVESAGGMAVLPYIACAIVSIVSGIAADRLIHSPTAPVSKGWVRKGAQTIGELLPAACLVAVGYVRSQGLAIVMLTACIGLNGVANAGFAVNHLDLSPTYAGATGGGGGGGGGGRNGPGVFQGAR